MLRESEKAWGGYLSISIGTIGTIFNLLTIIVVQKKMRKQTICLLNRKAEKETDKLKQIKWTNQQTVN